MKTWICHCVYWRKHHDKCIVQSIGVSQDPEYHKERHPRQRKGEAGQQGARYNDLSVETDLISSALQRSHD